MSAGTPHSKTVNKEKNIRSVGKTETEVPIVLQENLKGSLGSPYR